MKKSILFLALITLIASCKKEEEPAAFTPTDLTGNMVLKGNVSKNVVTPNGTGGWNTNGRIPANGVNVSVKVNKNSLYPNSTAQGADVTAERPTLMATTPSPCALMPPELQHKLQLMDLQALRIHCSTEH